jgi:hypothetical protein
MGRATARPPGVPAVEETQGAHCYYGPSHHDIRQDLRTMALGLFGLPNSQTRNNPLTTFVEQLWSQEEKTSNCRRMSGTSYHSFHCRKAQVTSGHLRTTI